MIQAIIFDCFGVLAEDGWTPFKRQYLEDKPEMLKAVQAIGTQVDEGLRTFEDMIQQTAQIVGISENEVRHAVNRKVPNEPLFVLISSSLKPHFKIGMLSNASYDVTSELFTREQAALFDVSVLSHEVGFVKPDPRMYQTMADRLQIEITNCLLVDDQERHCDGARAAGMQALVYKDVAQLTEELARLES